VHKCNCFFIYNGKVPISNEILLTFVKKNLGASFAIDFTIPFIKHEYTAIINDDMIFSIGWDKKLIETIEKNYPCTACAVLVERNNQDPLYQKNVISDDLGEIDETTFDKFNEKVKNGFYKINDSYSRQHPLILRTEDLFKVNGYTDGWDLNWYPGHCMDDYFPYRLLKMNENPQYKDIIVVFQTGMTEIEHKNKFLEAGSLYLLQKPFSYTVQKVIID
jgi:hypothetical protein